LQNQQYQLDIYRSPCHSRCKGLILLETFTTLADEELLASLPPFLRSITSSSLFCVTQNKICVGFVRLKRGEKVPSSIKQKVASSSAFFV
jgi:hypothetical protein